ncbi:hypothetical protein GW17_00037088 [Ensete ventricosum]|nr:hypothetical protein GW17_00037088 [Ensete ventricosum]
MDPGSSLGIRPGSDDTMGPRWEFVRRFTEGIEKLARNTLGDCWRKIVRLTAVESGGCQIAGGIDDSTEVTPLRYHGGDLIIPLPGSLKRI